MVTTTVLYNFTTTDTSNALYGGRYYGMKLISGHATGYIRYVRAYLGGVQGSGTFVITALHLDTDGSTLHTSGPITYAGTSTIDLDFGCAINVQTDQSIVLTTPTGDASNYLRVNINNNSGVPSNTNSYFRDTDGTVSTGTSEAQLMVFDISSTEEEECTSSSSGTRLPPPPIILESL